MPSLGHTIETRLENERRTSLRKERARIRKILQDERDNGAAQRFGRLRGEDASSWNNGRQFCSSPVLKG